MIKILGRVTSINVRKVLWTADALNLAYEREDWGLPLRDPNVPGFLMLNPNAQVPVLIEDGFVLWESYAIMRYLVEAYGPSPLVPENRRQRALMEQWLGWQASDLNSQWGYAVQALVRRVPGLDDEARIAASLSRWAGMMRILEDQLARTGAYVCGPVPTLADIALGLSAHRWLSVPRDLPDMPQARAYVERLRAEGAGSRYLTATTP